MHSFVVFFWLISSCRFRQDWRCRAIYWAPKKRCFGDPKPPELARAAKKTTLPQISPTPKTRRFLSRIFRLIHRFPHVRISQWNHTCSCFPYLFIFPYKSFFYFWLPDVNPIACYRLVINFFCKQTVKARGVLFTIWIKIYFKQSKQM